MRLHQWFQEERRIDLESGGLKGRCGKEAVVPDKIEDIVEIFLNELR